MFNATRVLIESDIAPSVSKVVNKARKLREAEEEKEEKADTDAPAKADAAPEAKPSGGTAFAAMGGGGGAPASPAPGDEADDASEDTDESDDGGDDSNEFGASNEQPAEKKTDSANSAQGEGGVDSFEDQTFDQAKTPPAGAEPIDLNTGKMAIQGWIAPAGDGTFRFVLYPAGAEQGATGGHPAPATPAPPMPMPAAPMPAPAPAPVQAAGGIIPQVMPTQAPTMPAPAQAPVTPYVADQVQVQQGATDQVIAQKLMGDVCDAVQKLMAWSHC